MLITIILKGISYHQFKKALAEQNINYAQIETKPSPFNTILWSANIDTKNHYLIGYYSFFDTQPITFRAFSKNHELLGDLKSNPKINQLINISKGWYTISNKENQLIFNDLRFGVLDIDSNTGKFAFSYYLKHDESANDIIVEEVPKNRLDAKKILSKLGQRILGN